MTEEAPKKRTTAKAGTRQNNMHRVPASRKTEPSDGTQFQDALDEFLAANPWATGPDYSVLVAAIRRACELSDRWPEATTTINEVRTGFTVLRKMGLKDQQQVEEEDIDPVERMLKAVR